MDYKEILTEEAAEQFRKEEATFVVIGIYKEADLIRTMEVHLTQGIFCVAGKNIRSEAMMEKFFRGGYKVSNRMWYPFQFSYELMYYHPGKVLIETAKAIGVDPAELEWMFINVY